MITRHDNTLSFRKQITNNKKPEARFYIIFYGGLYYRYLKWKDILQLT
jgi:hypothetical protein